ncbi:uncharacterized protein YhaN [Bacillus pakistanensis]|uniref:Uncharacterized protein YhaN n=1 Tax=Rossellomorea pakistanensis TaxID=992288 RepID=A0ABS2NFT0_9BACI|nr:AAA family ATPase [Bacillus pakistanensis]MBM7586421.1 uncharacterized protein YhaN [Bacillus pakistanensis]
MKIKEIYIYGYGKLENFKLDLIDDIQVIYGENEAGKSTIMSFIHSILFGFPTKQQNEPRYEPKTHSKYGGQLTVELEQLGLVTIERTMGKAAGDVTVIHEDGRTEGEEGLKKILNGMDKTTYQSIFSFNIHGLQNLHRLKEEDINRYLFSAGLTGTDLLLQLENQWQKEMDGLFKKAGRKPIINEKLTRIRELEYKLQKAKEKNKDYSLHIGQLERVSADVKEINLEINDLDQKKQRVKQWLDSWSLVEEYHHLIKHTSINKAPDFPVDGVKRYEKWQERLRELDASQEVNKERQKQLNIELEKNEPDPFIMKRKTRLIAIIDKQPLFLKWRDLLAENKRKLHRYEEMMDEHKRELGLSHYLPLNEIDTSMMTTEKVQDLIKRISRIETVEEQLTKSIERERRELRYIESRCEDLEKDLLPEKEFQEISYSLKQFEEIESVKSQYQFIREQIDFEEQKGRKSQPKIGESIITILLLVLGAWGGFTDQWLIAMVSMFAFISSVYLFFFKNKDDLNEQELSRLKKKAQEFENRLSNAESVDNSNLAKSQAKVKEQISIRESWKQWILKLEGQEHQLNQLLEEEASILKEKAAVNEKIDELKHSLKLPSTLPWSLLSDAYSKIKELIGKYHEFSMMKEEVGALEAKIDGFLNELKEELGDADISLQEVEESLIKVKNNLFNEDKKRVYYQQYLQEQERIKNEIDKVSIEIDKIKVEMNKLLESVDASNEEEFRRAEAQWSEAKRREERLQLLEHQIGRDLLKETKKITSKESLEVDYQHIVQSLEVLTSQKEKGLEQLAKIEYELSLLEEGSSYSMLLQQYQEIKADLNQDAKTWAMYSVAKGALLKTIERYKRDRLPKLMTTAKEFLHILTCGEYTNIHFNDESVFEIIRRDGIIFTPSELSQGTKEQVYVALRFALVKILIEYYPFPMIIDDGFVHFDKKRTNAVIQLIQELKKEHQVFFFTCHSHLQHLFQKKDVYQLHTENLANSSFQQLNR